MGRGKGEEGPVHAVPTCPVESLTPGAVTCTRLACVWSVALPCIQGRTMQKTSVTPEERLLTPPHPAPVTSYLSFTSVILSF